MRLLLKWLSVTLVIAISPQISSDIRVESLGAAVWAAFVYGVLFVVIGWLVKLLVLVLSIVPGLLTFGLFFLLVPVISNAVLLKLTAGMLGGLDIRSWGTAFGLSLVLTVIGLLIDPQRYDRSGGHATPRA